MLPCALRHDTLPRTWQPCGAAFNINSKGAVCSNIAKLLPKISLVKVLRN
jgi:hypothetical protein